MWGVHWERSVSLTGEKAEATGLNLFVEERSPMRTSLMLCRQYHHKTFFMAWSVAPRSLDPRARSLDIKRQTHDFVNAGWGNTSASFVGSSYSHRTASPKTKP